MSIEAKASALQQSLPSSCYTSAEVFGRECEKIFFREWLCAGREDQLPKAGDHVVMKVVGQSILIVRNKSGDLKAHYNVCRHRGAQLCSSSADAERVKLQGGVVSPGVIRCPYHQWTYSLDGELLAAPHLQEGDEICRAELSLYPVGLETWGGFFFLNLEPGRATQDLSAQMGEIQQRTVRYPLAELRSAHRITYDVAANWKLILENYNECYHCAGLHPELCDVVPAFRNRGGAGLDWERGIPHRHGAVTFTTSGKTKRAAFAGLNDDEKVRHKGELIYPNMMLSLACEHVTAFLLWPLDAGHTTIACDFMFHPAEITKADFDPSDAIEFWDLVNRQDWAICERVQLGMKSRVHKFGYYAPMEDLSLDIRRYIRERLGDVPE